MKNFIYRKMKLIAAGALAALVLVAATVSWTIISNAKAEATHASQTAIYYKTLPNGSDACLVLFWDVLENDGLDMNHALLTADFCNGSDSLGNYFFDDATPIKEQLEVLRAQLEVLKESVWFQDWFALIKEHQAAE